MTKQERKSLDLRMRMAIQYNFRAPFQANGKYYTIEQAMKILEDDKKN